jgi:hypothetical protein
MIVYDVRCSNDHVFEGWFDSSDSFEKQRKRKLVACPICGDVKVQKALMAPNIAAKGNKKSQSEPATQVAKPDQAEMADTLKKLADLQQKVLKSSEWVGRDFDKQARAMDAGEIGKKSIHGEVSPEEGRRLIEDGIEVAPLPFPVIPPDKRN